MADDSDFYEQWIDYVDGKIPFPEGVGPEYQAAITQKVRAFEDKNLAGWAAAGGDKAKAPPTGSLGVTGILGAGQDRTYEQAGPADPYDPNAPPGEGVESQLDDRFDLVPQALALQPGSTHPEGDQALKDQWSTGELDADNVKFAYEPTTAVARKHLLDNPALLRSLFQQSPPQLEEIMNMQPGDSLHQAVGDWMFRQAADAAAKNGQTLVRYSKIPLTSTRNAALKARGAPEALGQLRNAFLLGVDDTATFGAGRAAGEAISPEQTLDPAADQLGLNEATPQKTADINRMTTEDHPVMYGLGQGLGLLAPWSATNRAFEFLASGGRQVLGKTIAKIGSQVGGELGRYMPGESAAKSLGRYALNTGSDAAASAAAAIGTQAGQEAVDMASESYQSGELPTQERLEQAGERSLELGPIAAGLGAAGSLLGQKAHRSAQDMRYSESSGGLIGHAEDQMDWDRMGVPRMLGGPKLKPELRARARETYEAGRVHPVGDIADEIAPKIAETAAENFSAAKAAAGAETEAAKRSPEGQQIIGMPKLTEKSLAMLRQKHAPTETGGLRKVAGADDRLARDVFNSQVDRISLEPVEGAIELSPAEAVAFLDSPRLRELQRMEVPKAPKGGKKEPFARSAEGGDKLTPQKTVPVDAPRGPIEKPPPVEVTKPGAGDWRSPPIGGPGRIEPSVTLPADPSLENRALQRDVREAHKAGATLPQAGRPPQFYEQAVPAEGPPLRGHREAAMGGPPPPGEGTLPAEAAPAPATTGASGSARAPDAGRNANKAPLDKTEAARERRAARIGKSLRAKGVERVYIVPRGYDAHREEAVIEGLERGGKAETPQAQDYRDLQAAALDDRTVRGGGYAEMKARHNETVGEAAEAADKLGEKGKAFKAVVSHGTPRRNELPDYDLVRRIAGQAGVSRELDQARNLEQALELQRQARLFGASGNETQRYANALGVRGFAGLRKLEGAPGPLGRLDPLGPLGPQFGRAAMLGQDEDREKRFQDDQSARGRYERHRAQRLREIRAREENR